MELISLYYEKKKILHFVPLANIFNLGAGNPPSQLYSLSEIKFFGYNN